MLFMFMIVLFWPLILLLLFVFRSRKTKKPGKKAWSSCSSCLWPCQISISIALYVTSAFMFVQYMFCFANECLACELYVLKVRENLYIWFTLLYYTIFLLYLFHLLNEFVQFLLVLEIFKDFYFIFLAWRFFVKLLDSYREKIKN